MTDGLISTFTFIGFITVVVIVCYGISKIKIRKTHIKQAKEDIVDLGKNWKGIFVGILSLIFFIAFWGTFAWIASSCNPLNH